MPHPRAQPAAAADRLAHAAAAVAAELAAVEPSKSVERALDRLQDCRTLLAQSGPGAPRGGRRARAAKRLEWPGDSAGGAGLQGMPARTMRRPARTLSARLTVILLDGLLRAFGERYAERKRRRGAVDFDDLELGAGALLREHGEVAALWSERFERPDGR